MTQNRQGGVAVERHQGGPQQSTALTVVEVKAELEAIRPQLLEVLPQKMDPDRFLRVVAGAVLKNSDLLKCDRISLFRAVLEAAQLGLEPTGLLGSAYLVPYGRVATLIPGYRGLIDLARRSGEIESIYAQIVRAKDYFAMRQGTDPGIDHEPYIPPPLVGPIEKATEEERAAQDPGAVIGAYMVAVLRNRAGAASIRQIEWMTFAQIEAVRKRSRASGGGPWVTDWDEMARKTVVRRGSKYLPLTPEAVHAFSLDEEAERLAASQGVESGAARRESGRSRLLGRLAELSGQGTPPSPGDPLEAGGEPEGGSGPEAGGDGSATPPPSSEGTSDGFVVCGERPGDTNPLGIEGTCELEAGHRWAHRNQQGSWPR